MTEPTAHDLREMGADPGLADSLRDAVARAILRAILGEDGATMPLNDPDDETAAQTWRDAACDLADAAIRAMADYPGRKG